MPQLPLNMILAPFPFSSMSLGPPVGEKRSSQCPVSLTVTSQRLLPKSVTLQTDWHLADLFRKSGRLG